MSGRAIQAGALYFTAVFTAGFALGTVRTFCVAPATGELAAVAIEVPIMLAVAWGACVLILRRTRIDPVMTDRMIMGATALALLLVAEALVSLTLAGATLLEHLRSYQEPPSLLGLGAQLIFAALPIFLRVRNQGAFHSRVLFN